MQLSRSKSIQAHSRPSALALPELPGELRFQVPHVASPEFNVAADDEGATIEIFDAIGDEGVRPQRITAALREIGRRPITVQINSPGGDYFAGAAIFNILRGHQDSITVQVLGVAASAASIVAMAGDRIEIARNAEIMIHKAWVMAIGNADVMIKAAEMLEELDLALAGTYAARTGQPIANIMKLMSVETFMGSDQAIELGFADALLEQDAAPRPRIVDAHPQSRRELEAELRRIGFARAAARKIARGGWPALGGNPEAAAVQPLIRQVTQSTDELRRARR